MSEHFSLRELFELAQANASRIFLEDGEIVPTWHAVTEVGPDLLIASPWGDDEEKDMALEAIRDMFREHRVMRFVYITEAWVVMGKDLVAVMKGRPSQHPDRREVLRISAEDRNGGTLSGQYYILRPEHGPVTLSKFHEDPPNMVTTGRMAGLLDTATRH